MDCGPSGTTDCCASPLVTGGTFFRGYDAVFNTDQGSPATVSSFRLDTYEVTVGRYRKFVSAVLAGYLPPAGSGKHTHLPNGGLNNGAEAGWDPTWNVALLGTKAAWDALLGWTASPGPNEHRAMSTVDWPQAYAFCIWDGGFLPSEAEWNYAASGGAQQRVYPWSVPATSTAIDCTYANYNGCSATQVNDVGALSPKGDGLFGQADLAGNLWEWTLDQYVSPYPSPCNNCAALSGGLGRVCRGSGWLDGAQGLVTSSRLLSTGESSGDFGFRCARTP